MFHAQIRRIPSVQLGHSADSRRFRHLGEKQINENDLIITWRSVEDAAMNLLFTS